MKKPELVLVGAGPGDEELITIKGIRALESADVVLYDALVNKSLLNYCKPETRKIYVGKRGGKHHVKQFMINRMIVDYAFKYGTVVRLKGGDPFVFGRGWEEWEHAGAHGLKVSVVPGISSATAAPALAGIPLTLRGTNQSFWVTTGSTITEDTPGDLELAARSTATVIILMGMKNLDRIVELFQDLRGEEEPIAIVQNGGTQDQKTGVGVIGNISGIKEELQLRSPAIIIIGEIVKKGLSSIHATVQNLTELPCPFTEEL